MQLKLAFRSRTPRCQHGHRSLIACRADAQGPTGPAAPKPRPAPPRPSAPRPSPVPAQNAGPMSPPTSKPRQPVADPRYGAPPRAGAPPPTGTHPRAPGPPQPQRRGPQASQPGFSRPPQGPRGPGAGQMPRGPRMGQHNQQGPRRGDRGGNKLEQRVDGLVLNSAIPASEVRVLDQKREMIGTMPLASAITMAQEGQDDVILMNPDAKPPLVRICSVSKFKYEQEKIQKQAAKKQRESKQDLKELKMTPRTAPHDLEVRVKKAHKELSKGNKVRLTITFSGREIATMKDIAKGHVEQIHKHCEEIAVYETMPVMQGRNMVAVLTPRPTK